MLVGFLTVQGRYLYQEKEYNNLENVKFSLLENQEKYSIINNK